MEIDFVLKKQVKELTGDGTIYKLLFKNVDGHSLTVKLDDEPLGWPIDTVYKVQILNPQTTLEAAAT